MSPHLKALTKGFGIEYGGAYIPQKIKMFVWKLCHNIIPMKENLRKKRLTDTGICPIYNQEAKTTEHALLHCQWTTPVWFGLQLGLRSDNYQALNFAKC